MNEAAITQQDSSESQDHERTPPRKRGRPSLLVVESRTCPACGEVFETKVNRMTGEVGKGFRTTYCSRACSRQVANRRAGEESRTLYEAEPRRCPCGAALPYEVRNHVKSYCSGECRALYQRKRQRNEAIWETRVCRACSKPFEFRKTSRNAGLYCSNECAMKHTKTKHHVVLRDHDVLLDSSYEALVWGALRVAKIQVERFDRESGVEWSPGHWYAPDLWLPQQQIAIETKGWEDPDDPAKWAAFRSTGVQLLVFGEEAMVPVVEWICGMISPV